MKKQLLLLVRLIGLVLVLFVRSNYLDWFPQMKPHAEEIQILAGFFVFFLAANILVVILSWIYRKRRHYLDNQGDNVVLGLKNIYYILMSGAIVTTILGLFGIDPKTLFTTLSIVAAAIAIISKEYISEIISGIIISFSSNEISVGDYLKIGAHKGKIIDLGLTKIAFLDEDDDIIFIPNTQVFASEIVNYTKKQIRRVSIEFEASLHAVPSVEALEVYLTEALKDYHDFIEPGSFWLRVVEIKKDSLFMKFQYVLKQINRELEIEIRRRTVRRLVAYIKERIDH
ncbi:MAG: mechanosensitive ion channel domain-containing protein [Haliscomenobacter sp.]